MKEILKPGIEHSFTFSIDESMLVPALYAFMQAIGMVNDHMEGCAFSTEVEVLRNKFKRSQKRCVPENVDPGVFDSLIP